MTTNNPQQEDLLKDKSAQQDKNGKKQGHTIGHYMLGKALGEGTFGKVKLGTHILTGEKVSSFDTLNTLKCNLNSSFYIHQVAVKVLEKSRIKDKKDVERISREIKILKQLHHPNVVQIYEIIETEKDLYLVMEFVSSGELFDIIVQNQRLSEKQACKYFQELISGIKYIHELGICHRDLKPENLLVDYDKSLKIVDFGLSNLYDKGCTLKTACGSPCYAAPEMIAGNKYDGLMSDLWSCGVVLYAMLCGFLPYEDQKTSELYKKILNATYTLPDFLSDDAKDMIKRIFNTDPNKRITVDQIRAHPWYQLNKPEIMSFHIVPQPLQEEKKVITKKGKQFQLVQRPNLLNEKILTNLEQQQGFNRESLLKSIRNNKHNHLTATYYLLLKKHMIRQLKSYVDAFMELRPIEDGLAARPGTTKQGEKLDIDAMQAQLS